MQEQIQNTRLSPCAQMLRLLLWIIQQFLKMDKSIPWTTNHPMRQAKEGGEVEEGGFGERMKEEPLLPLNYQEQCFINNSLHNENQQKNHCPTDGGDKQKPWTQQEEKLLVDLHNQKGNRWVQIARQLQRSDNSVKNHYHSRLRKALRKINKCISDHLSHQGKMLKINILSRVIQAAQGYYSEAVSKQAAFAYRLKNQMLDLVDLTQQQCSQQQIGRVRSLFSQLTAFNQKNKKQDRTTHSERTPSNKYKGKEIISLLQENMINSQKDRRHKDTQDEEESILFQAARQQEQIQCLPSSNVGFNGYYFYNQPIYPIYFSIVEQSPPSIFSGKPSSFTFYCPQSEKASEPTWTSIPMGESV